MNKYPEKSVCISGAGQSAVGRPSDKSALALTLDACAAAIADAGLTIADIDGLTTYPGPVGEGGFSPVGATETMLALGLKPVWVGASTEGRAYGGDFQRHPGHCQRHVPACAGVPHSGGGECADAGQGVQPDGRGRVRKGNARECVERTV